MQVVLTVNGPGEVCGWLHPLSAELKARLPGVRIVACALPCVFSTGSETGVIRSLGTVDAVAGVGESLGLILRGRRPEGLLNDEPTLVFHLGGEVALSVLLGLRLGAPRPAYLEHPTPVARLFRKAFCNGLARRAGDPPGGTVGELMVDAAALRRAGAPRRAEGRGPCIALFPGSRAYLAVHMLPYCAVVVEALNAERPGLDWVPGRAPYVPMEVLRNFPPPMAGRSWEAVPLSFAEAGGEAWLETPRGVRIRILTGPEAMAEADLALTVPDTNTGELAASGVPMVVALPTYLGHEVPLPGIPGHLGRLPVVGRRLKRLFGELRLRRLGLLAQPNVRAGRRVVPELVGEGLQPTMKAELERLLDADTSALRAELRALMGAPGAARRLAEEIAAVFEAEAPLRAEAGA